jgi:hypothetical protein
MSFSVVFLKLAKATQKKTIEAFFLLPSTKCQALGWLERFVFFDWNSRKTRLRHRLHRKFDYKPPRHLQPFLPVERDNGLIIIGIDL